MDLEDLGDIAAIYGVGQRAETNTELALLRQQIWIEQSAATLQKARQEWIFESRRQLEDFMEQSSGPESYYILLCAQGDLLTSGLSNAHFDALEWKQFYTDYCRQIETLLETTRSSCTADEVFQVEQHYNREIELERQREAELERLEEEEIHAAKIRKARLIAIGVGLGSLLLLGLIAFVHKAEQDRVESREAAAIRADNLEEERRQERLEAEARKQAEKEERERRLERELAAAKLRKEEEEKRRQERQRAHEAAEARRIEQIIRTAFDPGGHVTLIGKVTARYEGGLKRFSPGTVFEVVEEHPDGTVTVFPADRTAKLSRKRVYTLPKEKLRAWVP